MARIKHYDPEKQEWVYSDKAFASSGGGGDYVLTDADKQEIAELAADLVDVPEVSGGGGYGEVYRTVTTETYDMFVIPFDFRDYNDCFVYVRVPPCTLESGEVITMGIGVCDSNGKNWASDYVTTKTSASAVIYFSAEIRKIGDAHMVRVSGNQYVNNLRQWNRQAYVPMDENNQRSTFCLWDKDAKGGVVPIGTEIIVTKLN